MKKNNDFFFEHTVACRVHIHLELRTERRDEKESVDSYSPINMRLKVGRINFFFDCASVTLGLCLHFVLTHTPFSLCITQTLPLLSEGAYG